jgi:hypothetical protein
MIGDETCVETHGRRVFGTLRVFDHSLEVKFRTTRLGQTHCTKHVFYRLYGQPCCIPIVFRPPLVLLGLLLANITSQFRYPTKGRRPSLPLHPRSEHGIQWVVEEILGAIPIHTSKFGSIGYPLRRRRGIGGLRPHAVVSVVRFLCPPSSGLALFGARPLLIYTIGGRLSYALAHWP